MTELNELCKISFTYDIHAKMLNHPSNALHFRYYDANELKLILTGHVNIRSIGEKIDSLLHLLETWQYNFSVIALTETWITDNALAVLFDILGYTFIRKDRKYGTAGGGVALYIFSK